MAIEMKKIDPLFLKSESSIEDAMSMFKVAIDGNNLNNHLVKDWGDVYLSYLTDPEGWLGVWMLKSDELAAMVLKCRLWDTVYIKDEECVQSIRPVDRSQINKDGPEIDAYDQFPLADDIGVPMSLRLSIINMTLVDSLNVFEDTREVMIKPVKGFYDISKELTDGDVLPFQNSVRLSALFLNKHILEVNNKLKGDLDNSKEHNAKV